MKLRRPVKIVETDHAGFQVSGWKSLIDKQSLGEDFTDSEMTNMMAQLYKQHKKDY